MKKEKPFTVSNAACVCKTVKDVQTLLGTKLDEIVVGSITFAPRNERVGTIFFYDEAKHSAINSIGLANNGYEYYDKELPKIVKAIHHDNKKIVVSIAPIKKGDLEALTNLCIKNDVDTIEVNLSCPNIVDKETGTLKNVTTKLTNFLKNLEEVYVLNSKYNENLFQIKMPPLSQNKIIQHVVIEEIKKLSTTYRGVPLVICNTLQASSYKIKGIEVLSYQVTLDDKKIIHGGGISGKELQKESLATIKAFKKRIPTIEIIGVGGINSAKDIQSYKDFGVKGVQIGTALYISKDRRHLIESILKSSN